MNKIILKKNIFDLYSVLKFRGTPLDALADFLIRDSLQAFDEANFEESFFIKWLEDRKLENGRTGGNTMDMEKRGKRVYIGSQFREKREDVSECFSTTTLNMIRILRQWYSILAMNPLPDEVHLVQEGDEVLIVPKFTLCEDMVTGSVLLKA